MKKQHWEQVFQESIQPLNRAEKLCLFFSLARDLDLKPSADVYDGALANLFPAPSEEEIRQLRREMGRVRQWKSGLASSRTWVTRHNLALQPAAAGDRDALGSVSPASAGLLSSHGSPGSLRSPGADVMPPAAAGCALNFAP